MSALKILQGSIMPGSIVHAVPCQRAADLITPQISFSCECVWQMPGRKVHILSDFGRFFKGAQPFACNNLSKKHATPFQYTSSADNLNSEYLLKPSNAIPAASHGDVTISAVQERHVSQNGALPACVLSVKDASVREKILSVKDASLTEKIAISFDRNEKKREAMQEGCQMAGLLGDGMLYHERFVIRCYEVDTSRRASVETIANLLQEVACNHARSLGFSTDGFGTTPSMRKRRLIWVTSRMHIEFDEYPAWGEMVEIATWFQDEGRVGMRRDWDIRKVASGDVIGRATSTWVMMNQDTRRLSRITDDVRAEYMAYLAQPPRWAFSSEHNYSTQKIPKLEENAQYIKTGLMPRRGDLDMNQHVNNVTYIGWMLESLPAEVLGTRDLRSVTLEFRHECKHENILESMTSYESLQLEDNQFDESIFRNGTPLNGSSLLSPLGTATNIQCVHLLRLAGSGIEINRGRTEWEKKASSCSNKRF